MVFFSLPHLLLPFCIYWYFFFLFFHLPLEEANNQITAARKKITNVFLDRFVANVNSINPIDGRIYIYLWNWTQRCVYIKAIMRKNTHHLNVNGNVSDACRRFSARSLSLTLSLSLFQNVCNRSQRDTICLRWLIIIWNIRIGKSRQKCSNGLDFFSFVPRTEQKNRMEVERRSERERGRERYWTVYNSAIHLLILN